MKKINKFLLIFLAMVFLLLFGAWQTIQSAWFAEIVKNEVSTRLDDQFGVNVKFRDIKLSLLPLSTSLNELEVLDRQRGVDFKARELKVLFSLSSLFRRGLEIEGVILDSTRLEYQKKLDVDIDDAASGEGHSLKDIEPEKVYGFYQGMFKEAQEVVESLPVSMNFIEVKGLGVKTQDLEFSLNYFLLKNIGNTFELDVEAQNLNPSDFTNKEVDHHIDKLTISLHSSANRLRLSNLEIFSELSVVSLTGFLDVDGRSYFSGYYRGELARPFEMFYLNDILEQASGYLDLDFYLDIESSKISSALDINLYDFQSPFIVAKEVQTTVSLNDGIIGIERMNMAFEEGQTSLISPISLGRIEQIESLAFDADLALDRVHTNDLLYFFGEEFQTIKSKLSGDVNISYTAERINLLISEQFKVQNFVLESPVLDVPILNVGDLEVEESLIQIHPQEEEISLDLGLIKNETYIPVLGSVKQGHIDFLAERSLVNLADIGPVSGIDLKGVGEIDFKVRGPLDDVVLGFDIETEESSLLGLNLGYLVSKIEYNLSSARLDIKNATAQHNHTKLQGHGQINFFPNEEEQNLSLYIDVQRSHFEDFFYILEELTAEFDYSDLPIDYFYEGKVEVGGGFEPDEIFVNAKVNGSDLIVFGEDFSFLEFDLSLNQGQLDVENISLEKGQGGLNANLNVDIFSGETSFKGTFDSVSLSEIETYRAFGLGLDGQLDLSFWGETEGEQLKTESIIHLKDSQVLGNKIGDSKVELVSNGQDVFVDGAFLGELLRIESFFDLEHTENNNSYLNIDLKTRNINSLFGVLSAHNLIDDSLKGEMDLSLRSEFDFYKLEEMDLYVKFERFFLEKNKFILQSSSNRRPEVTIENGVIKNWDFSLSGASNNVFNSRGRGSFKEEFEIVNNLDIEADIIGIVSDKLQSVSGRILAETIFTGSLGDTSHLSRLLATDLDIRLAGVPGVMSSGIVDIVVDDQDFILQNLNFNYGKGNIRAVGNAQLTFPFPQVDFRWSIENTMIPILRRSQVTINGTGGVTGESMPYLVRGNIDVVHGQILDSMDDFQQTSGHLDAYKRFIPTQQLRDRGGPLRLDFLIDIDRPVVMRNSLVDLLLVGDMRVTGNIENPLMNGEIRVVPERSRFKFKGYDFVLSEGRVSFVDDETKEPPELNFVGTGQIGQYRVNLEVGGQTENVSIAMSSDPPLGQDDILSLLTLGVTRSVSRDLDEGERQQLATIGLGALLFDQFELTEGITSDFGLRFSVSPEISEDESSLIRGRYGVSDEATRVRSATRIRVQRRVSDRVDLSVSSTVGGSLEQKQEMNINYRVNDRLSVEGVYEIKSREENVTNTPDSIGMDLKWRWSF